MNLNTILDDCLERLKAGETVTSCLARYPAQARTLAPMLRAATELRTLADFSLSDGQKLHAKVVLREALVAQAASRPRFSWLRLRAMPAAALLSALLFVVLTVTAVASSQPGDWGYPLRVVSERVPVFMQFDAGRRANAELIVAERRLAESSAAHPSALQAFLASDEAAVRRAERLTSEEQIEIAERVSTHAQKLITLAEQAADPAIGSRLNQVAEQVRKMAGRLVGPTPSPWSTVVVGGTPSVTPSPVSTASPATDTPRPRLTEVRSTVTPRRPLATATRPVRRTVTPPASFPTAAWPTATPWAWPTGDATWAPGATTIAATRTPLAPRLPGSEITPPVPLPTGTVVPPRYQPTATPDAGPQPSATVRHTGGIILTATAIAPLPPTTETPQPPRVPPPLPEVTATPPAPPRSR